MKLLSLPSSFRVLSATCMTGLVLALSGCAQSYYTPGPKAELAGLAPVDMEASFAAKPTLRFPASIVAMHVQGDGYSNYATRRQGGAVSQGGGYAVITTRDDAEQAELDRLGQLPQVAGMVSVNRMLLPPTQLGERELRMAASRLQADLVWLYTFDTRFFDHEQASSLKVISLGFLPTRKITVTTVASGLLIDTRTGYVYAASEATAQAQTLASAWGSEDSADEQRRISEREAFAKLAAEFTRAWPGLIARHGGKPPAL